MVRLTVRCLLPQVYTGADSAGARERGCKNSPVGPPFTLVTARHRPTATRAKGRQFDPIESATLPILLMVA
jgi:hypothetical protein